MPTQTPYLTEFIQDACVLIVIAYLLSRVFPLRLRLHERLAFWETIILGTSLGLIGQMESFFLDTRIQYSAPILFAIFATFVGGLNVGLITATVVSLGVAIQDPGRFIATILAVFIGTFLAKLLQRKDTVMWRLLSGFAAGGLAQACRLAIRVALAHYGYAQPLHLTALLSIPANAFGVALLLLVVSDAQVRADSERRHREALQANALAAEAQLAAMHSNAVASEAQLAALRARIHPHFLFNALNSIAELCCIAPARAEAACINLSQLMRQALETSVAGTTTLGEEIALVQAYLQVEQERLGERMQVVWELDTDCESQRLVPFSIQILVENAINHGLARKLEPGTVTIKVRCSARHMIVAVRDDGIGMTADARRSALESEGASLHGLRLLDEQLRILNGPKARLRLFGKEDSGTLATFLIPIEKRPVISLIKEKLC